jgi:hypothetical protein
MDITQHAKRRMTERGISRRLVDFTLRHGRIEGDRHVLDRNESRRLIEELEEELRLARRAYERGGVTVVGSGDTLITAFNVIAARVRHGSRRHQRRDGRGEAIQV